MSRQAAFAAVLALTIVLDVPNAVLATIRRLKGRGSSSPLVLIPAMVYVGLAVFCRTTLFLGPVAGLALNVGARLLDIVGLIVWHALFVWILPAAAARVWRRQRPHIFHDNMQG